MANYCAETDIEGLIGYAIDTGSRPTTAQTVIMMTNANIIINNFLCITSDLTGASATAMKPYACTLVTKMINNLFALAEPEKYAMMELILTDADKIEMLKVLRKWAVKSWEMGD